MPRLRGHHLICLHFFNGEGYDAGFIEDLRKLLDRAAREDVQVVAGPDDVCSRCPHLDQGRCACTAGAEEEIAAMDHEALGHLGISPGTSVKWEDLRRLIPEVYIRWYRAYCLGCDWRKACEGNPWFRELSADEKEQR